jgi:hypothetical protein
METIKQHRFLSGCCRIATCFLTLCLMMQPSAAFGQHVLDSTNFHIEWGNVDPNNPERVDVLQWKGGLNLIFLSWLSARLFYLFGVLQQLCCRTVGLRTRHPRRK